ncbi:uncharacterized protein Kank isoform X2 [Chelonus insularis]|uniref:uncharacterized protein Kank isoform X2 n=1 Tax=Chelonus insularis TaxID=460826 RepID=UPI00158E852E|nr:uncharacterized protein LOC118067028 isoform X2 [Chelonus insularis]
MKRLPFCKLKKRKYHGTTIACPIHPIHVDQTTDFDAASIGSGNSNLSTGALQNIREQMAISLERMKELEEQVKIIPVLQVQVSVLKEEKRSLQKQVEDFNNSKPTLDVVSDRLRSQSFSDRHGPRSKSVPTRDMGVMCGVMTRDVGVSHQQVRTRDTGMVTSTPIQPAGCLTNFAALRIDEADFEAKKTFETPTSNRNVKKYNEMSRVDNSTYDKNTVSLSNLSQSSQTTDLSPIFSRKHSLERGPLKIDNYFPDIKQLKDTSTNTDKLEPKRLTKSDLLIEEIAPAIIQTSKPSEIQKRTRTFGTETRLKMRDVRTPDDIVIIIEDAVKMYKESIKKETVSRGTQCIPEVSRVPLKVDKEVQISEPFKMRSNVGVMVKPRTSEAATDAGPGPGRKSIATGPDPVALQPISLNSMNSRSHSFNYGDTKPKRKTTKSVGVIVEGLVKTSFKSTDTVGLAPKRREFGTSPMKKKFVDVSVGDSLKPHISISCAANYCDNCKETIKNLAKQILNNNENNYRNENNNNNNNKDNGVSRIPRPSHITLNNDFRKQFKRQDTYTKIPSGLIRYDVDNKETYDINNKLQQLATEEHKDEKKESKEISSPEKEIITDEKGSSLPESALFEPIRDKSRVKKEPSREMRAAMKVLNDNLKKSPSKNISHQIKNATNVIQQEWFKISSTASANPLDVEDYLDCFEEYSSFLLEYIVNMTDSSGNTAMHYAVSHGNFDVVSILLDSKVCDINTANVAGYTAVMLAALAEVRNSTHASVANRLFQLADVNIRAKLHGQTALMLAVSHGRKDMTRLLLDAGAAVNIQDEDGSTALMCAAEHGHIDIVRLLLAHPDCDSSIVDVDGSSALKIALEAGHRDIGVLLYAHERVNRGTSPHSSMRRSRRGSKPTTPTGPSPSAPASPAPSRRFHSSNASLTKYSGK